MPHFKAKYTNLGTQKRFLKNGLSFSAPFFKIAPDSKNSSELGSKSALFLINQRSRPFILQAQSKKDFVIFKAHKADRGDMNCAKEALKALSQKLNCEILDHNLDILESRQEVCTDATSQFLLDGADLNNLEGCTVEIGFGSGRNLLKLAKENPDEKFLGIEIHEPSIRQVLRQIELLSLKNLFIIKEDSRQVIQILKSIKDVYIHFPIPFHKHPFRKIMSEDFLRSTLNIMRGKLHLRTDDERYFLDSKELADKLGAKYTSRKNTAHSISSKYEDRWIKLNRNFYDLVIEARGDFKDKKLSLAQSAMEFSSIDLSKLNSKIGLKYIKDGVLVSIDSLFIGQDGALLLVNLGSMHQSSPRFIFVVKDERAFYLKPPLPTVANIHAHEILKKILTKD